MATWLSEYQTLRNNMDLSINESTTLKQLMLYQELIYRVSVLETCQSLCKSAPISSDISALSGHYKLVDAYIQYMANERRLGYSADDKLKAMRETAYNALNKIVLDCRKRFSSFKPSNPEQYKKSVSALISTVLPVWLQFRNTYININKQ